jgi:hypothetical protein
MTLSSGPPFTPFDLKLWYLCSNLDIWESIFFMELREKFSTRIQVLKQLWYYYGSNNNNNNEGAHEKKKEMQGETQMITTFNVIKNLSCFHSAFKCNVLFCCFFH